MGCLSVSPCAGHVLLTLTLPFPHTHDTSGYSPLSTFIFNHLFSLSLPPRFSTTMSSADSLAKRSAQRIKDDTAAVRPLDLFAQVQEHCCEQASAIILSDVANQYITAHKQLISRYCCLFHQQAEIPSWCEHSKSFDVQLQRHMDNFSWWLTSYSYVPSSRYKEFGFRLFRPLPAGANMFDAMLEQGCDLHDAYIMDTNGDSSPTFAVYREMQELAPSIIKRILTVRVMKLTKEEERSAIKEMLTKKRKRASEQMEGDTK